MADKFNILILIVFERNTEIYFYVKIKQHTLK